MTEWPRLWSSRRPSAAASPERPVAQSSSLNGCAGPLGRGVSRLMMTRSTPACKRRPSAGHGAAVLARFGKPSRYHDLREPVRPDGPRAARGARGWGAHLARGASPGVPRAPRVPARPLRRPTLGLAVAFNRAVRQDDEWWDEPDDLERVQRALARIDDIDDPVRAAGALAYRIARAQGFAEGNKRTALLLARWVLDRNGRDGRAFLPPNDWALADLLVTAASELDVEADIVNLLSARR